MADPRTINIPGSGTDTQQYTLAPGLLQYVQAVYVEIDNTNGSDTRPVLTISEQSGVVIAKKRQGESVPGFDTGSATWALRLVDEFHGIEYDIINQGGFLDVRTSGRLHLQSGDDMTLRGDGGFHVDAFRELALVSHSLAFPLLLFSFAGVVLQDNTNTSTHQLVNGGTVGGSSGTLALVETFGGSAGHPHSVVIRMFDAKNVQVEDSQGNALFRVDADGSLHGKTGKALTFDL